MYPIKSDTFTALTFSEFTFQLLTPKILTDFSRLNLAYGFSRGVKNLCVLFVPTAEAVGYGSGGYLNRKTVLRQNHPTESRSGNGEMNERLRFGITSSAPPDLVS
jgi:hypothetical protein